MGFDTQPYQERRKGFIKIEDLADGPLHDVIEDTDESKYGPFASLKSGRAISLNDASVFQLIDDFGKDPDDWRGRKVTISLREFDNGRTGKIVSARIKTKKKKKKKRKKDRVPDDSGFDPSETDDDIPF